MLSTRLFFFLLAKEADVGADKKRKPIERIQQAARIQPCNGYSIMCPSRTVEPRDLLRFVSRLDSIGCPLLQACKEVADVPVGQPIESDSPSLERETTLIDARKIISALKLHY